MASTLYSSRYTDIRRKRDFEFLAMASVNITGVWHTISLVWWVGIRVSEDMLPPTQGKQARWAHTDLTTRRQESEGSNLHRASSEPQISVRVLINNMLRSSVLMVDTFAVYLLHPHLYVRYTYLLTPWSFLRSLLVLQLVKKFPAFSEPEGSSPYPQAPATCPYPEPTPSSPHNSLPLPEDPS